MYTLLNRKFLVFVSGQFILILKASAVEPDFKKLMWNLESAHWPLQEGYPGLVIYNLNEYVSLFHHCLVNIQNYQGIEIIGIQSPIYLTRYDSANLEYCYRPSSTQRRKEIHRFLFGKIPPKSEQNCSTDYSNLLTFTDKSFTSRWYCRAQIDVFFPEPQDAPHIVYRSQSPIKEMNSFDINDTYFKSFHHVREAWS